MVVAAGPQQGDKAVEKRRIVVVVVGPSHGDDRQKAVADELADADHGALKRPLAAHWIIRCRIEAVDRDAEFQAVRRRGLGAAQAFQPLVLAATAVVQYHRMPLPYRRLYI